MAKSDRIELRPTKAFLKLKKKAEKGHEKLKQMQRPHKKIAVFLDQWVQRNFKTEGGNVGGWPPLKAGGRSKKGRFDAKAKILQDTGALRLSHIPFANRRTAGIGSDLKYSKTHDKGLKGIPQRRTLPKWPDVKDGVEAIFDGHVKEYRRIVLR